MNKAAGADELPMEVFKNKAASAFLHILFQHCFTSGKVPNRWQKGIIHPIPQKSTSDPRDPLAYRGITLAPAVYKLYCNVLNNRLVKWAERNDHLTDNQNGFRKKHSCLDHLGILSLIIDTRRKLKQSTYALFVDFSKAFDRIDRDLLWTKLVSKGSMVTSCQL